MLRRWTDDETRVLKDYIDTHVGHCGGLDIEYWTGLSRVLESVRKEDDTILQKHQVTNKIIAFRKRQVSCKYILEHGISENQIAISREHRRPSISTTSSATMTSTEHTSPTPSDNSVRERILSKSNRLSIHHEDEDIIRHSTSGPLHELPRDDLDSTPDPRDPNFPGSHTALKSRASDDSRSAKRESRKQIHADDSRSRTSSSKRSIKKSRESRAKRKRIRLEETFHNGTVEGRLTTNASIRGQSSGVDELPHVHDECNLEVVSEAFCPMQGFVDGASTYTETSSPSWQDSMFQSWQNHLALQHCLHVTQSEPPGHRDISHAIEGVARHIKEASSALHNMFPKQWSFSSFDPSLDHISTVLTGCQNNREAEDVLRISQSLMPLSTSVHFAEALIGTIIHLWVFKDFQSPVPTVKNYDPVRSILDQFIERECPKLWTEHQNLYRLHFLSSYTTSRIAREAETLADATYVLLSSLVLSSSCTRNACTSRLGSSTNFTAQTLYYQAFNTNMTQAFRIALDLSISFAKCCDLVYDFDFPKIRDKFDPSSMEARESAGSVDEADGQTTDHQLIAVGLIPAIWSRKRNGIDFEKARTLVTKAVVLL